MAEGLLGPDRGADPVTKRKPKPKRIHRRPATALEDRMSYAMASLQVAQDRLARYATELRGKRRAALPGSWDQIHTDGLLALARGLAEAQADVAALQEEFVPVHLAAELAGHGRSRMTGDSRAP